MELLEGTVARLKLRAEIIGTEGTRFQDVFADLMELRHGTSFRRVRPYGIYGDLKCDGYLVPDQIVYQCYAPRTMKEDDILRKIAEDFEGAKQHWKDKMKCWTFVHNDNAGLPPRATQFLLELDANNPDVKVDQLSPNVLIDDLIANVPAERFRARYGELPTQRVLDHVSFLTIKAVVEHVARQVAPAIVPLDFPAVNKLECNGLSDDVQTYLRIGRRREKLVDSYFSRHPQPDLGDQIATAMRNYYVGLRVSGMAPDDIFARLQSFTGGDHRGDISFEAGLLAVLCYFFERCDIFENPSMETEAT